MDKHARAGPRHLDDGQVTDLWRRLQALDGDLKMAISRETQELGTSAADRGDDTTPSFSDLGEEVVHREEVIERRLDNAAALEEVRAALARMVVGGYGICVDCRRQIPAARLIARPQAARDIACQRRLDQRAH